MTDTLHDLDPTPTPAGPSRRRFLLGAGIVGAGAVLAACGDDDEDAEETGTNTQSSSAESSDEATTTTEGDEESPTTEAAAGGGDAEIASLAASLEVLAVATYGAALEAAGSGALGDVPPAVAEFVTTAQAQHQEHLDALNGFLEGAGQPAVTAPPTDLEETVNGMFAEVTDVAGAANLALTLEEIAAQTYLAAIPSIQDTTARQLAGAICCIDRQHAAVLRFVLGQYPVPDVFAPTDQAYSA